MFSVLLVFFSPRPKVIYSYAAVVCTRTVHFPLFVFIPSACLSSVETNSSGKVEKSSSAPCPGHQAAENHKNLNGACSTSAETGVSSRDDPGSSRMSQHVQSRDIAPYSHIYTFPHPTYHKYLGFLAVGIEGFLSPSVFLCIFSVGTANVSRCWKGRAIQEF